MIVAELLSVITLWRAMVIVVFVAAEANAAFAHTFATVAVCSVVARCAALSLGDAV